MAAARHSTSRGTSVLDVLVAVSILATLLAIGVPNLGRLKSPYALSGATRQIASDLQGARQRAIARNVRYRVNFDVAHAAYTIERENAGAWLADSAPQPLPAGVTLGTVTPGNPIFDTRGMLAAQVAVSVSMTGSAARTVTINVLGKTTIS